MTKDEEINLLIDSYENESNKKERFRHKMEESNRNMETIKKRITNLIKKDD